MLQAASSSHVPGGAGSLRCVTSRAGQSWFDEIAGARKWQVIKIEAGCRREAVSVNLRQKIIY